MAFQKQQLGIRQKKKLDKKYRFEGKKVVVGKRPRKIDALFVVESALLNDLKCKPLDQGVEKYFDGGAI